MRLLVIDASPGKANGRLPNFKEGDIVEDGFHPDCHDDEYFIPTTGSCWLQDRFIPLSDKDEQAILFHRLEDQMIANLCEELSDERNFIGEDIYY